MKQRKKAAVRGPTENQNAAKAAPAGGRNLVTLRWQLKPYQAHCGRNLGGDWGIAFPPDNGNKGHRWGAARERK
jgi:hypothetical protein